VFFPSCQGHIETDRRLSLLSCLAWPVSHSNTTSGAELLEGKGITQPQSGRSVVDQLIDVFPELLISCGEKLVSEIHHPQHGPMMAICCHVQIYCKAIVKNIPTSCNQIFAVIASEV